MENQKPTSEEWKAVMDAAKLEIGTPVIIPEQFGEYFIEHFTDVLPPIMYGPYSVLCSEPYDFEPVTFQKRFIGIYKKEDIYYAVITTIDKFVNLR